MIVLLSSNTQVARSFTILYLKQTNHQYVRSEYLGFLRS